ncbi:MAG: hypothetical protein H7Y03_01595, partial [Chitinophagaceae bacterium]|nr:hypothetical protein [Chitinophagaceae bacterium]
MPIRYILALFTFFLFAFTANAQLAEDSLKLTQLSEDSLKLIKKQTADSAKAAKRQKSDSLKVVRQIKDSIELSEKIVKQKEQ